MCHPIAELQRATPGSAALRTSATTQRIIAPSPPPLKIPTTPHQRHALIHDRLADPEVVLDPFLEVGGVGEGVGSHAGAGWSVRRGTRQGAGILGGWIVREACASSDAGEEGGDEDGVEGPVG